MTALYSVRWTFALGLAYVLLSVLAAAAVTTTERNLREAQRIVQGYTRR
jgi:hypothetical protein